MSILVPFLPPAQLRTIAADFLRTHGCEHVIPIPIELLIERSLNLDIVPMDGLELEFDVDAYLTQDLREIRVDATQYRKGGNRFRFSLAHEAAHLLLHLEIIKQLPFKTISGRKQSPCLRFPENSILPSNGKQTRWRV